MTSGQSAAMPRSTAGCPLDIISARNCAGVGASHSSTGARTSVRDELISVPFAAARIDAFCAKRFDVRLKPFGELRFVAWAFGPPRDLRQGKQAREGHELEVALRRDELRPHASLDAEHVRGFFGGEALRDRFPGKHLGDRLRAALVPFPRRTRFAFTLMIVEVEFVGGGDDEVVTALSRGLEHVGPVAAPPLDDDAFGRLGFYLLVPGHRPLAEAFDGRGNLAPEISL